MTVLRRALPDVEEFRLHQTAGLGIESAKGLVHQQKCGPTASVRAIAARCFMLLESCEG
ncbi:MAG TPA: hypothetical protein VKG22_04190 [Stellaceae bacterium]|nr:hypothetical protein [Stellaceae bacterium]